MTLKPDKVFIRKENQRSIYLKYTEANYKHRVVSQILRYKNRKIHHNQVEFIPVMLGSFNTRKLIAIIYNISRRDKKNCIITLIDVENVFDNKDIVQKDIEREDHMDLEEINLGTQEAPKKVYFGRDMSHRVIKSLIELLRKFRLPTC